MVDTGIIIFDTSTFDHEWKKIEVPQLLRKTIKVGEKLVADPYHHIIYEVEGDMAELSTVEDNILLDKKVTKKEIEDTALILEPEMTLEAEVTDYLKYILQVSDETIEQALKELNDNLKDLNMG
jgi:hypothetical protein